MTKLSKRIPDPSMGCEVYDVAIWHWLKELAEYVEFIDRCEQGLREEATHKKKFAATYPFVPVTEKEYEPQTYDEAVALVKGWKHYIDVNGLLCWENPSGSRVHLCHHSWEDRRWPELWKEMVEALHRGSMYLYENEWVFNFPAYHRHRDSTPGRVVCQAYLCFRNRRDWAERLSK